MIAIRTSARFFLVLGIAIVFSPSIRMNAETAPGTGIEGSVRISPTHGGPIKLGEPDSGPLANATLVVESAAGATKMVTTDEQGHFKIELPPGRYSIRTEKKIGIKGRGCGMNDIEVTAGAFKQVKWDCDTGMR